MKIRPEKIEKIRIAKSVNGKDRTLHGAFSHSESVSFSLFIPRALGIISVIMRISADGGVDKDLSLEYRSTELGVDEYRITLDLSELCLSDGLFYYEFIFDTGELNLFTCATNNVDFELTERSENRFRLLVYDDDFKTPSYFYGKTVYHVFVDRFCKGSKDVPIRDDAVLNEDWENGIPQYAESPGHRLSNNVFFGGTIYGVIEKLSFIKELGADVIYLSPIFEAYSNHKYDTGNYERVDEMFGGDDALAELISEANKLGMKIILDGVFNHSGDDSVYFDKYGRYGNKGAYGDPSSPYADWYTFKSYPDEYECWWGIDIHPRLNHKNAECRDFFVGKDGITAKYVRLGTGGWRLDVADELSDEFLDSLRASVKSVDPEAIIIGEVWENAADKIAYGNRRRYLRGKQFDSVMNYPLRSAVIDFLRYRDAVILSDTLTEIYSSYPKCVCDCLLNILSTHDTERILTTLGGVYDEAQLADGLTNAELSVKRLPENVREEAKKLLKMAAVIQFTVYGIPSVFYGDEAGVEGYHDPFCRKPYPWEREDEELLEFYRHIGDIRRKEAVLIDGDFSVLLSDGAFIAYQRGNDESFIVAVNRGEEDRTYQVNDKYIDILSGKVYNGNVPRDTVVILKKV